MSGRPAGNSGNQSRSPSPAPADNEPRLHPTDNSILADDYKGKSLDPAFSKGPVSNRSVSDLVCCIVFLVLLGAVIVNVVLRAPNSKFGLLGKPKDSENNICGYTKGFTEHPYLFVINHGNKKRSVCVKSCPRFDYNQIRVNSTGNVTYLQKKPPVLSFGGLTTAAAKLGTKWDGVTQAPNAKSPEDPALYLYNPQEAQGYYSETAFMSYLRRQKLDCAVTKQVPDCAYDPDKQVFIYDTRPSFLKVCSPRSPLISAKVGDQEGYASEDLLGSLKLVWHVLLLAGLFTLLINLMIIAFTIIFPKFAVWVATILAVLAIFGVFLLLFFLAVDVSGSASAAKAIHSGFDQSLVKMKPHVWILYVASACILLLLGWILYKIVRNSRYFSLAAVLLSVSGKLLIAQPMRLIITLCCFAAQTCLLPLWLYQALILYTSGELSYPPTATMPSFSLSPILIASQVGLAVVMVWSLAGINNLGDYMNAWTTSEQYFRVQEGTNLIAKLFKTIFKHGGTIMVASAVQLPCMVLQGTVGHLSNMLPSPQVGSSGLSSPYRKFIKRIRDEGLFLAAHTSAPFCTATKEYHYLELRTEGLVGSLNFVPSLVGSCLFLAGTGVSGVIWILIAQRTTILTSKVQEDLGQVILVLLTVVAAVSYLTQTTLGTVVDTVRMCFLIELDTGRPTNQYELEKEIQEMNIADQEYKQLELAAQTKQDYQPLLMQPPTNQPPANFSSRQVPIDPQTQQNPQRQPPGPPAIPTDTYNAPAKPDGVRNGDLSSAEKK